VKLKTLLPAILLLLLLTPSGSAQTLPESQNGQSSSYGIEPGQLYPGTLLLELMEIAEAEIDEAASEAYAAGYKAAMLRYAPDAEAYRSLAQNIQAELEAERRKNRWLWPAVGISAGLSFIAGFLLHSLVSR
jgi:hypothetical protein